MKLSIAEPLDTLLNGGIESGCITNFYGPSATGKTNVVICACVSCIDTGKKVLYIDTEGGFSLDRLKQIAGPDKKYTDNILLLEPKDWKEQIVELNNIEKICSKENIGLIVVDSITAHWRLIITDDTAQEANRHLASQLSLLSKLARTHNIPVLITNQVYEDIETGKIELSSRNIVKWWSKNLIELTHASHTSHRYAIIRKARAIEEDKQIEFRLTDNGIEKPKKLRLF